MSTSEKVHARPNTQTDQGGVVELAHPLIQHHLTRLRDERTGPHEFRNLIRRLAVLLAYEATQDLVVRDRQVKTPLTTADGHELKQRIGLVPILRAGLGMVDSALDLIPHAEVWHLGLYRDETTAQPVEYYSNLPESGAVDVALILDPMLATGGSAVAAVSGLKARGAERISFMCLVAAPVGVRALARAHPDVPIYAAALDRQLNDHGYILPGLGDAGDRLFGTK